MRREQGITVCCVGVAVKTAVKLGCLLSLIAAATSVLLLALLVREGAERPWYGKRQQNKRRTKISNACFNESSES